MENLEAGGTECVATYSPPRVASLGIARVVFGLLVAGSAFFIGRETAAGNIGHSGSAILPERWMYAVCAALAVGALCLIAGGVGRIVSSFARDCYFCAGLESIAVRLPWQGWLGSFHLVEYRIHWDEIRQIVSTTRRVNMIPVGRELRIERHQGKPISIEQHFFSADAQTIQQKLETIKVSMKS